MIIKIIFIIFLLFVITLLGYCSFWWGALVSVADQINIVSEIRNISSIIFGVLGVWVAIVYPEALSNMLKRTKQRNDSDILKYIFYSIRICTFIVLYAIVVSFCLPVFKHVPLLSIYKNELKALNVFIMGASSFSLFMGLLFTFIPLEVACLDIEEGKKLESDLDIKNRHDQRKKKT